MSISLHILMVSDSINFLEKIAALTEVKVIY